MSHEESTPERCIMQPNNSGALGRTPGVPEMRRAHRRRDGERGVVKRKETEYV
jgi:hypothetical protein